MRNVSFLTPTYFFSSIQKGSGKSVILSNTAIFLNNSGKKIAIIDFESCTPLKLKNSFPDAIILQEYADISALLTDSNSRYKKAFYFTDTEKISLFPAFKLKNFSSLFLETAMRDFFIQLQTSFDTILINLPSGISELKKLPNLISKSYIWRGQLPSTVIVSLTDQNSLVKLDKLILKQPVFSYLFKEQTMLFFNKIPLTSHQHKSNSFLTASEIKRIFNFPIFFSMSELTEIPAQILESQPIVLDNKSILNHTMSHFCRLISTLGKRTQVEDIHNNFRPLIDENIFNTISPMVEKLQATIASNFFLNKSDIQIFLEEDNDNYRIRVRICGTTQTIRPIETKIALVDTLPISSTLSPVNFKYPKTPILKNTSKFSCKDTCISISVRPLYRFDDRFNRNNESQIFNELDFECLKPNYVSPLIFKQKYSFPDVPTLTQMLGFIRSKFIHLQYSQKQNRFNTTNITHFFIPPKFNLSYTSKCLSSSFYSTSLQKHIGKQPALRITLNKHFDLVHKTHDCISSIHDVFKRNWKISDHLGVIFNAFSSINPNLSTYSGDFNNHKHSMLPLPLFLFNTRLNGQQIEQFAFPKVLPILEKELSLNTEVSAMNIFKPVSKNSEPSFVIKYSALPILDRHFITNAKYDLKIATLTNDSKNNYLSKIKNAENEIKVLNFNTDKIHQKANQLCNLKHNSKLDKVLFTDSKRLKTSYNLLKVEQLLLNFDFIIKQLVKTSTYIESFQNSYAKVRTFEFNTNFTCSFFVFHVESPLIATKNIKKLNHIFHPPGTGLDKLNFRFEFLKTSKFDLLPTYMPSERNNSFLQHANAMLGTDFVIDSYLGSKLSLSYRNFLRIFVNTKQSSNLLLNLNTKILTQKKYKFIKYPNNFLTSNLFDFEIKPASDIYKINANRNQIMNHFNKDINVCVYKDKRNYHLNSKVNKELTFAILDVKLRTIPLRRYFNYPIQAQSRPSLKNILITKLQIYETKHLLTIVKEAPINLSLFRGSNEPINKRHPLRYKANTLPKIITKPLVLSINPEISCQIFNLETNISHLTRKLTSRFITPTITELKLKQPPLVTPQSNLRLSITIEKPQFKVPIPQATSILFEHLKHTLKQYFIMPIKPNKEISIIKSNKTNISMPITLSCKKQYSLSEIYDFSPVSYFNHLKKRTILKLKDSRYRDIIKSALKSSNALANINKENNQ